MVAEDTFTESSEDKSSLQGTDQNTAEGRAEFISSIVLLMVLAKDQLR